MTVTTIPITGITVDGVALNTLAKTIESKSGRLRTPGARGANTVVANRSGALWVPNKPYEEGRFILPMWVMGCDDDGLIPGGSTALKEFYKNKDMLQRLFAKRRSLLEVVASQPDGTSRRCLAECTAEVDYEMFNENDARMAYEMTVPSTFWEDASEWTYAQADITANTDYLDVASLSGGTAPMEDLMYEISITGGNIDSPRITDLYTNDFIQLSSVWSAGTYILYDAATWSARKHTAAINWDITAGENRIGNVLRSNTISRLITLTPHPTSGNVSWRFSAFSFASGATAQVRIKGRRKYLS